MTGDYYNWWYPAVNVSFYFNSTFQGNSGWMRSINLGGAVDWGFTPTLQTYGPGQYYQSSAHDAVTPYCTYNGQNSFSAMCGTLGCIYPPPWNSWAYINILRPTRPDYAPAGHPVFYLGPGVSYDGTYSNNTSLIAGNPNGAPETPQWVFAAGSQFGTLNPTTGNQPLFTATRRSTACLAFDVVLKTSYNGFLSDPFYIFINTAWNTIAVNDKTGGTWVYSIPLYDGYATYINYKTMDMCGNIMYNYHINESFGAWQLIPGSNWLHGPAGGTYVPSDGQWWDIVVFLSGTNYCAQLPCVPAPANPGHGTHTLVQWVPQSWFVGSASPGAGERIQTDTLQRYTDSAWHNNIVDPAPP